MKKKLGLGMSFVGAFLLVAAILAQVWVAGALMKTPLDTDTTTRLSGTATLGGETFDVLAYSVTHADSELSDGSVVSFQNSSCLVRDEGDIDGCVSTDDPDDRLITASEDDFATDRTNALAVDDPKYTKAGALPHEGLINKWPFQAEQKSYPYWDSTLERAVEATFDSEMEVDGLKVYVYKVAIDGEDATVAGGGDGTYTDAKEIWVEPLTGAIINQVDSQQQASLDGQPIISVDFGFTDDQIKINVEDAKANASSLNVIRKVLPLVGYILGIPLLLAGLYLVSSASSSPSSSRSPSSKSSRRGSSAT